MTEFGPHYDWLRKNGGDRQCKDERVHRPHVWRSTRKVVEDVQPRHGDAYTDVYSEAEDWACPGIEPPPSSLSKAWDASRTLRLGLAIFALLVGVTAVLEYLWDAAKS